MRKPSAWALVATGVLLVAGSLLFYQLRFGSATVVTSLNVGLLEDIAYLTLGLILLGLTTAFLGLTLLLRNVDPEDSPRSLSFLGRLGTIISEKRAVRVLVLVAVIYGLLFAFVSSTLSFQPGQVYSKAYGVTVPSSVAVLCCGSLGQLPEVIVYFTQDFAVLIVPTNVILLFLVSWLVGLNAAIANFSYAYRPRFAGGRWMSGLGALVGLFTVCPSCAGIFFLSIIGLGSAVGLALTISSLQTLFIVVGIPFLLISPLVIMSRIPEASFCSVNESWSSQSMKS